jgi:HAD superfamily hydrolase (TIGR01549 family)
MASRRIDLALFDLDDTLHDDTLAYQSAAEEVAREVAAEHGIDALALKAAYIAEAEGFWKKLDADSLKEKLAVTRARLWRSALDSVGVEDDAIVHRSASNYHAYRKKYFTLFPGAAELLRGLRARGMKLGMITNGLSETHREKIALLRIGDLFDAIFIADEVGMLKPDPLLFAHACTKLECSPSHSAMIGDRYDRDIRGAHDAGLFTVWVNVRGETVPEGAPPPDATCDDISGVALVL